MRPLNITSFNIQLLLISGNNYFQQSQESFTSTTGKRKIEHFCKYHYILLCQNSDTLITTKVTAKCVEAWSLEQLSRHLMIIMLMATKTMVLCLTITGVRPCSCLWPVKPSGTVKRTVKYPELWRDYFTIWYQPSSILACKQALMAIVIVFFRVSFKLFNHLVADVVALTRVYKCNFSPQAPLALSTSNLSACIQKTKLS